MWANWVLNPLDLVDRDGGHVRNYRLILDGGWGPGEIFAWLTSDVIYLFVIIPAAYSSQLLDLVINPGTWLKPIETAWTAVTSKLFAYFSPTVLLAVVLVAALVMIAVRARNADEALKDMASRTTASMGMYVLILALLYNPAGTLLGVLTGWVHLLGDFVEDPPAAVPTSTATADATPAADSSVLTNFLRPLTWMLNYGSQLSPECAKAWVRLIENNEPITCLTPDQVQASQSVGITFVMTLAALIPVWIYCRFALVVVLTFTVHLGLALLRFASAALMAALAPWQDRPFDEFLRFMLSAAANLIIATGILGAAKLGPVLAVAIAQSLTDNTLVHIAVLIFIYYLLAQAIWALEKMFGPVRDWLLKAASSTAVPSDGTSRWWSLAFPGGLAPEATALDRLVANTRQRGSQWAAKTRERVTSMAHDKALPDGTSLDGQGSTWRAATTPGLAPDTPQSQGARAIVDTLSNSATVAPSNRAALDSPRNLIARVLSRRAPSDDPRPAGTRTLTAATETGTGTTAAGTPSIATAITPPSDTISPWESAHTPQESHPAAASAHRQHWRERLRAESRVLTAEASQPSAFGPVHLGPAGQPKRPASTFTDSRGNALEPLDSRASVSAQLAQISYIEIVMRAMGFDPVIDTDELLPDALATFTSGVDEDGNWTTTFHT